MWLAVVMASFLAGYFFRKSSLDDYLLPAASSLLGRNTCGVGRARRHEAGTMKMALHENALLDTLLDREVDPVIRTVDVPLITIDALVSELGLARVDFIKMDIEGAEPNALRGARNTLRVFRPQMSIATEHSPGELAKVTKAILSAAPYRSTCGRCMRDGLDFYPEVTFYTPE